MPDYGEYVEEFTTENLESSSGELDWTHVESLLQELEKSRNREKEIVQGLLNDVEDELDDLSTIHEENIENVRDSIRRQKELLKSAKQGSKEDVGEIRNRLAELYRELRRERREWWQDKQDLHREKRELEREISEIRDDGLDELI